MFKAVRILQRKSDKDTLIVNNGDGIVTHEQEKIDVITSFFKETFYSEHALPFPEIEPKALDTPFTSLEISKAASKLKNNKSAGCDNIKAELIKYGPDTVYSHIAELLNEVAKTGHYPEELKTGHLVPLPKPGKPKGPPKNLRPIILLSVLRKILAICIIQRTFDRIRNRIPISQAAYSPGRNTTELVFAFKILAEKAITSSNYETHLLMLDMSKAFDTIERGTLIEDLKEILNPDEVHLISILIKDVKLAVKCGKTIGETFLTNTGAPQGDCASPIFFTLYLSKALNDDQEKEDITPAAVINEHSYAENHKNFEEVSPPFLHEHSYSRQCDINVTIDQQYADDTGWSSNNGNKIAYHEKETPPKLKKRSLNVNTDKTEKYAIKHGGSEDWKDCKYLGSKLDTEKDIARRKQLANAAYQKLSSVFSSRKVSKAVKIRLFNAYICSIFLYNSELWSLTSKLENSIDVFQRRLLRRIIGVTWPKIISNESLYRTTTQSPWSREIGHRRLKWLGHVARLPDKAPARLALQEALRPTRRPQGRPKTTWIQVVTKQLQTELNIPDINTAINTAQNRKLWGGLVARAKSAN